MEADWEAQVGPELPVIQPSWEGFVDLRRDPVAIRDIPDAARYPAMARALTILNGDESSFFTAKSDVWSVPEVDIDPYEFAADRGDTRAGIASYIDVVEFEAANFASYSWHEHRARNLIADLRDTPVRNGRVDVVIRAALAGEREGYGFTLYTAGCGDDEAAAIAHWESVLNAAVAATMRTAG
jgi:hypothetical protein